MGWTFEKSWYDLRQEETLFRSSDVSRPDMGLSHNPTQSAPVVDFSWNVMAHDDASEGKWRGNWRMEWGSQYYSHYLGTLCIQHFYSWCARLGCQQSTELTPLVDLRVNGLVRFAERRNLVSARVPSHFKRSLTPVLSVRTLHCAHTVHWCVS